tara:strand:+ start:1451 stop:1699 length:249 start_codon:yes stop_codon:yes gene_type:complete
MYIVKNKLTGFKQYFSKDQYFQFYNTTGMQLIKKGKRFTDNYSVKIIKNYNLDKIMTDTLYFLLCMGLLGSLLYGFIYYSTF